MHDQDIAACRAAIAALEGQRATLGDTVLELATAPLRARLGSLLRPAGVQRRQVTVLFADVVGSGRDVPPLAASQARAACLRRVSVSAPRAANTRPSAPGSGTALPAVITRRASAPAQARTLKPKARARVFDAGFEVIFGVYRCQQRPWSLQIAKPTAFQA